MNSSYLLSNKSKKDPYQLEVKDESKGNKFISSKYYYNFQEIYPINFL